MMRRPAAVLACPASVSVATVCISVKNSAVACQRALVQTVALRCVVINANMIVGAARIVQPLAPRIALSAVRAPPRVRPSVASAVRMIAGMSLRARRTLAPRVGWCASELGAVRFSVRAIVWWIAAKRVPARFNVPRGRSSTVAMGEWRVARAPILCS